MTHTHTQHRRATLAELMVAVALASVVMLGVTKLLLLLSTTEKTTRQRHETAIVVDRLLAQFQQDVHAAVHRLDDGKAKAAANSPAMVRLQLPGSEEIEYRQTANGVERIVRRETQIIARDVYRLPEFARVEVRSDEAQPGWLTFAIAQSPSPDRVAGMEALRVPADLGRDIRYAAAVERKSP